MKQYCQYWHQIKVSKALTTEGVETPQTTDRERLAENDLSQRKGNFKWRVND